MAAHRIIRVTNNSHVLPRCKSEGTLVDLSEGTLPGAGLSDVKGQASTSSSLNRQTKSFSWY